MYVEINMEMKKEILSKTVILNINIAVFIRDKIARKIDKNNFN
jgi:hypothetical protein